jgi:hypothetical protein
MLAGVSSYHNYLFLNSIGSSVDPTKTFVCIASINISILSSVDARTCVLSYLKIRRITILEISSTLFLLWYFVYLLNVTIHLHRKKKKP